MIFAAAVGVASSLANWAVDAYRARLQAQVEQRRQATLQLSLLISTGLAAAGLVVDAVTLHLRAQALQQAVEESVAAGDLEAAELLRGHLLAALADPPASARLMATLAEYIPALLGQQEGAARVIEGEVR